MELEIFEAFRAAGVPDDKARGVVAAISDLIDRRYALHADQLATRGDVASGRAELNRRGQERTDPLVRWFDFRVGRDVRGDYAAAGALAPRA